MVNYYFSVSGALYDTAFVYLLISIRLYVPFAAYLSVFMIYDP